MPAVSESLVPHAASALVQRHVREMHEVIRIGDLNRVREHRVEHDPVRGRQIQRRPTHPVTTPGWSGSEPRTHRAHLASGNNIEQLPVFYVDDLGRPALFAVAALTLVGRLVQPGRRHRCVAGCVVDQHAPEQHDRVVHGVPVTGEIVRYFEHRPTVLADLTRRPSRCACRVSSTPCFDLDPQPRRPLPNTADYDIGQANKERTHARRIGFQQGLLDTGRRKTPSALQSPCPAPGTYSTLKSEAPVYDKSSSPCDSKGWTTCAEQSVGCRPSAKFSVDVVDAENDGLIWL